MATMTPRDVAHLMTRPGVKVMGYRTDFPPAEPPLFVSVPIAVKSPNGGWGCWQKANAMTKRQRQAVRGALEARYGTRAPKPPLVVTCERRMPKGGKRLDDDNLAFAFKRIRDEIAEWLGTNDGPNSGIEWRYEQVRDPEVSFGTVGIRIETPPLGGKETT